jgi:hypothetical protein
MAALNVSQSHLRVKPTCGYFPLDLDHLISFVIQLNENSLNHQKERKYFFLWWFFYVGSGNLIFFGKMREEIFLLPHVEMFIVSCQLPSMINQNIDPEKLWAYVLKESCILLELDLLRILAKTKCKGVGTLGF